MGKWHFLELNRDEIAELDRPVNGTGGFESFLRDLQKQINHATSTIKLTDGDLVAIPHYAFDSGQGGFESRLLKIFGRALGPKLGREE